ncbi:MAG: hypothetical protein H6718_18240 [Polyangiaceae bacterium]|nr:hypothetical protein [Polyangiaceae bacterium]MCB9605858.1 hypothetical protein [Polyangiaceae bacterium]
MLTTSSPLTFDQARGDGRPMTASEAAAAWDLPADQSAVGEDMGSLGIARLDVPVDNQRLRTVFHGQMVRQLFRRAFSTRRSATSFTRFEDVKVSPYELISSAWHEFVINGNEDRMRFMLSLLMKYRSPIFPDLQRAIQRFPGVLIYVIGLAADDSILNDTESEALVKLALQSQDEDVHEQLAGIADYLPERAADAVRAHMRA